MSNDMKFIMENWKRKIQESNAPSFLAENEEINASTDLISLDVSQIKDENLKAALDLFQDEMIQLAREIKLAEKYPGGEQDAADAREDRAVLRPKIKAIKDRLQQIANSANATKTPKDDKAVTAFTVDAAEKVSNIDGDGASNAEVEQGLEPVVQDLTKAAAIVKKAEEEEQSGTSSGDQSQERRTVTLDNTTPKLQQLANAFVQLSDEQYDQLRQVLANELDKAKVEQTPWEDLPQGLQQFGDNTALFMFSREGSGYTLKPQVTDIVPIKNKEGEDVKFEITQNEFQQQYQDNEDKMEQIGDKLEQQGEQEMTNDKEQAVEIVTNSSLVALENLTPPLREDTKEFLTKVLNNTFEQNSRLDNMGHFLYSVTLNNLMTNDQLEKMYNIFEVSNEKKPYVALSKKLQESLSEEQKSRILNKIRETLNPTTDSGEQEDAPTTGVTSQINDDRIKAAAKRIKDEDLKDIAGAGGPFESELSYIDILKGSQSESYKIEILEKLEFVIPDDDETKGIFVQELSDRIVKAYDALDGDTTTDDSGEQTEEITEKEANQLYGRINKRIENILNNPKFATQQVKDVKITQFFNALKEKDFEKYQSSVGKTNLKKNVFDRLADIVEKFPPSSTKNGSTVQDLLDQANRRLGNPPQGDEPEETEADFPEGTKEEIKNSVLQIFEKVKDQIEEETHVPTKRALAKFLSLYLEASKEPETITENNMELALDMNDAFVRAYRVLKSDEQELVSTAFNKLDSKAFNEKFELVDADLSPEDEEEKEEKSTESIDALLQLDGEQFMTALAKFYRENDLINEKGIKKSLLTLLNAFRSLPDEAPEPTPEPEETEVDTDTDTDTEETEVDTGTETETNTDTETGEEEVDDEDPRLQQFELKDMMELNRRGMEALLENVEKEDLRKALKNASPEILDFFLSYMSEREAQDLREEIEFSGEVPDNESREAEKNIIAAALKLKDEGVIFFDKPDEEEEEIVENLLEGIYLVNEQEEQSEVGKAIATLTDVETIPDTVIPFERVGELRDKLKSILKVKDEQVKSPDAAELTSEEVAAIMQGSNGKELMRVFIDTLKEKFNGKLPEEIDKLVDATLDKKPGAVQSLFDSTMLIMDPLDANELKNKIAKFYPPDEELDSALSAGLNSSQKKILKAIEAIFAARQIQKIDGDKAKALPTDFQTRFVKAIPSIRRYEKEVMKALAISFSGEVGRGVFAKSNMNEFVDAAGKAIRGFQKKYMGQKRHEESRGLQDIMASVMDEMEFMRRRGAIFRTFKTPEFRSFYGDLRDLLMNIMQNPEEIKIDDKTMDVIIDVDDLGPDDDGAPTIKPGEQTGFLKDLPEDLQNDVKESKAWIDSLPDDERTSVEIFVDKMMESGAEILPPTEDGLENVDEAMTDYHRDQIDTFKKEAGVVFPSEFAEAMKNVMEELQDPDRDRVANLMYTEQKRFINYLTTVFTLKQDLGIEPTKSLIGLPTPSGDKMTDPDDDFGDSPFSDIDARGKDDPEEPESKIKLQRWFNSLEQDKKTAVGKFANNIMKIRGLNEVSIPTIKKIGKDIERDHKKVFNAFMDLSESEKSIIEDILKNEYNELVLYIKSLLKMKNPEDVDSSAPSPFDREEPAPDTSDDSDLGIDPERRGDEEDGIEDSDFADKNAYLGKVGLLADKYISYSKNKNSARGELKQLFGTITEIVNEMKRKKPNLKSRIVVKALMSLALIYVTPESDFMLEKKGKKKNTSDVNKAKGKIRPILTKLERYEDSLELSKEESSIETLKLILRSIGGPMANLFRNLKSSKPEVLRLVNTFKTKKKGLADLEDGGVEKLKSIGLEESLKPIIERMLLEHYTGV